MAALGYFVFVEQGGNRRRSLANAAAHRGIEIEVFRR